jgi:gas vesicle protein
MTCNTKTESQSGNMLLALLAGVGAGVVVGLAIAPKSGQKLRADIGSTVDDYLDSAGQKAEEVRQSAANLAQRGLREVQRTAGNASDKLKDMVNGTLDAANSAVDNGAAKGHEVIGQASEAVRTGTRG